MKALYLFGDFKVNLEGVLCLGYSQRPEALEHGKQFSFLIYKYVLFLNFEQNNQYSY